jgi:hypothetical protein
VLVLAIWLFLAGYTIAITGKRNLGLSYQPQADGSIKAVDEKGNAAKAYSLMDVIQCQDASVALGGQPPPLGSAQSSRPAGAPAPNPIPQPGLLPLPNPSLQVPAPAPNPIRLPGLPGLLPQPGTPLPGLGGLLALERALEREVYKDLHGLAGGLRRLPALPGLPGLRPS